MSGPWDACYVCGSHALPEGYDIRNPLCTHHLAARSHVISMRRDDIVCSCGWAAPIPMHNYADRERACRAHWLTETEPK